MSPSLPAELIHRIIILSLPEAISFDALPERYRIVLPYALVCKAWTPWAQLELYRHVMLDDKDRAADFVSAVGGGEAGLGARVQSLRLRGLDASKDLAEVQEVVATCSALKDLRLSSMRLELDLLRVAPTIQQLHLHRVELCGAGPTLPVHRQLCHLSFVEVLSATQAALLLNARILPSLSSLSLASLDLTLDEAAPREIGEGLKSLGPQLESLSLRDPFDNISTQLEDVWCTLTAIRHLTVQRYLRPAPASRLCDTILPSIPSSLEQLRLTSLPGPGEEQLHGNCSADTVSQELASLAASLGTSGLQSLQSLQRLWVPNLDEVCSACAEEQGYGAFQELTEATEQHGVDLQEEGPEPDDFDEWETYLDEW